MRSRFRTSAFAGVIAVVVCGSAIAAADEVQPDGSVPPPPYVAPETITQPDGSDPPTPVIAAPVPEQPISPSPQVVEEIPAQIDGAAVGRVEVVGSPGRGVGTDRKDEGGIFGGDAAGGRTDG